jgi:hypothetical protein
MPVYCAVWQLTLCATCRENKTRDYTRAETVKRELAHAEKARSQAL